MKLSVLSSSSLLSSLLACSLSVALAACATEAGGDADADLDDVSSEDALTSGLAAGTFQLYTRPGVVSGGECDAHTLLGMKSDGTVTLSPSTTPPCVLSLAEAPRTYRVRQTASSCQGKTYEGGSGRGAGRRSIVIHDYRKATYARTMASIVVDEKLGAAPMTTLYAAASASSGGGGSGGGGGGTATTVEGTLVQPREGGYRIQTSTGELSLELDAAEEALFRAGKKARARGPVIAAGSAQSMNVEDLLVCPDPGTINCMPGPNRRLSSACAPENHPWISASCPGVSIVF